MTRDEVNATRSGRPVWMLMIAIARMKTAEAKVALLERRSTKNRELQLVLGHNIDYRSVTHEELDRLRQLGVVAETLTEDK